MKHKSILLSGVILWSLFLACCGEAVINFNFAGLIPSDLGQCRASEDYVETFDYIIVGAGPAGCALASRLSEDYDRTVLLLELGHRPNEAENFERLIPRYQLNGPLDNPTFSRSTFTQESSAIFQRRITTFEGQSFGGGTNIYSGINARPSLEDIAAWNWPGLNAEEALYYFKKTENNSLGGYYHGEDGPLTISYDNGSLAHVGADLVIQAAGNLGFPTPVDLDNGVDSVGVSYPQRVLRDGRRISAYDAYLPPYVLNARSNLFLQSGARVLKVLIDDDLNAYGVSYLINGTIFEARAFKEVILSAGVSKSPQLLMLSGIGPADKLQNLGIPVLVNLTGVGQNYVERPRVEIIFESTLEEPAMNLSYIFTPEAIQEWNITGTGPLAKGAVGVEGFLSLPIGYDVFSYFTFEYSSIVPFTENLAIPPGSVFFICSPSYPQSRGEVYLVSADPLDEPRRQPYFLEDPYESDITAIVSCVETVREIAATEPFSEYILMELSPGNETRGIELDGFIAETVSSAYHAAGTCKFGSSCDPGAVIDAYFRVRGVSNLRVVDSSVLPELLPANPTATIYMLAERAADVIKEQWASS